MTLLPAKPNGFLPFLALGVFLGGCAEKGVHPEEGKPAMVPVPSDVDTTTRNSDYESRIASGWPFPVEVIAPQIVDYPPDFVSEIRGQFLGPLAESPYAGRIAKVEIHADSSDWSQWTCVVHPRGKFPAIRIEGENAFRDGRVPDAPYGKALETVLSALARLDRNSGADNREDLR